MIDDRSTKKAYLRNYKSTDHYLEKLKQLALKLGYTPSRKQAAKAQINTHQLTKRLNTNWLGVIEAANLDPKSLPHKSASFFATKEDIIKDLCRVSSLTSAYPSIRDYKLHGKYGINTVKRILGSWQNCMIAAGFDLTFRYENRKDRISRPTEFYLKKLRDLAQNLGRAPTSKEASDNLISTTILYQRLKTHWAAIVKIAGINPLTLPSVSLMRFITNHEVLEDITTVASLIGHKPSITEYKNHGRYSAVAIRQRFGGKWSNVLDKIELDNNTSLTQSNELITKSAKVSVAKDIALHNSLEQESVKNVKGFFDRQNDLSKPKK